MRRSHDCQTVSFNLFVFQQQDLWHGQVSDVRAQLRFLEEVETLQKKRKDEEERERLLRFARVSEARKRFHSYLTYMRLKLIVFFVINKYILQITVFVKQFNLNFYI